ncbi:hypothetical protein BH09ACT12_BH09ACT12_20160 [soil metagenome]
MSEEQGNDVWDDPDVMLDRPESTGLAGVDAVIDAVAMIGSVAVPDHVGVYEQAHVQLRAVLDDPDAATDVDQSA